jgi:hypothetical protein
VFFAPSKKTGPLRRKGVASLAKARRARGLPALARPVEPREPVARVEVSYAFHGDKAAEVGRLALQLYGEQSRPRPENF